MRLRDIPILLMIVGILILGITMTIHQPKIIKTGSSIYLYSLIDEEKYLGPIYIESGGLRIDVVSDKRIRLTVYREVMGMYRETILTAENIGYNIFRVENLLPSNYIVMIELVDTEVDSEDRASITLTAENSPMKNMVLGSSLLLLGGLLTIIQRLRRSG